MVEENLFYFFFLRRSFALVTQDAVQRLYLGSLQPPLPSLSNSPASASRVTGTTGASHHICLIFVFLVEIRFHHVGQAGLELLTLSDVSALASQSVGITAVSHCAQPLLYFLSLLGLEGSFISDLGLDLHSFTATA